MRDFLAELRRRRIWWVAGVYVAASWIIMQVVGFVEEPLQLPDWADTLAIVLLVAGLPVAIILAWAQETQAPTRAAVAETPDLPTAAETTTIAVLPFNNMSVDEDQAFLAEGMSEDIITRLAQLPGLSVTARNSTFQYKGQSPDVREVGKALSVQYVIEGSVRKIGDRVRITAQLIDARTGSHVWAENYDRPTADIFEVQDDVVENIALALEFGLTDILRAQIAHEPVENLEAWALCLKAGAAEYGDQVDSEYAIGLLRDAIRLDPDYAMAHAMLASRLGSSIVWGRSENEEDDLAEVIQEIDLALRLGGNDLAVMNLASNASVFAGNPARGLELASRAVAISPTARNQATLMASLISNGRLDEAKALFEQLKELFPVEHFAVWPAVAIMALLEERYEDAEDAARRGADIGVNRVVSLGCLASSLGELGRYAEARQVWAEVRKRAPSMTYQIYSQRFVKMGFKDKRIGNLSAGLRKAGIE